MIKFVMCLTRHPDMSREEFKDYWMNNHGPFLMSQVQHKKRTQSAQKTAKANKLIVIFNRLSMYRSQAW